MQLSSFIVVCVKVQDFNYLPSLLQTVITRQECGTTKLCAAEPSNCNPAAGDSCYFLSVKQQSGQIYNFELSGQSDGYVAAGLSTSVNVVCHM